MNNNLTERVRATLSRYLEIQHNEATLAPTFTNLDVAAERLAELFTEVIRENAGRPMSFAEFVKETTIPVQFVEPSVSPEEMETIMSSDLLVDQPVGSAGLSPVVNPDPVETTAGPGVQAEAELAAIGVQSLVPVSAESTDDVVTMQLPDINTTPEVPRWWEENDKEQAEKEAYAPVVQDEPAVQYASIAEATDANFDMTAMKMLTEEHPFLMFVKLNRTQKGVSSGDEAILRTVYNDYVKSDAQLASRLREIAGVK